MFLDHCGRGVMRRRHQPDREPRAEGSDDCGFVGLMRAAMVAKVRSQRDFLNDA